MSVDDRITVIITASPRPADPDLSMIQETIASVRRYLPTSPVLVGCDGVREEQPERAGAYQVLLNELCEWVKTQHLVYVLIFPDHRHQTGMVTALVGSIDTPFVLFMEQDAPLEGDIVFGDILATMHGDKLNVVRFLHEVAVHDEAAHLFLERTPTKGRRYVRTVQYSSRPQVVRTSVMRQWTEMWGPKTRSMIEDFLYGWYEHGLAQYGLRDTWARGRMAIWAPGPNMKHSGHLDGRGSDPKFPIHIEVEGETPPGSPHNGDYDIGGIYS